MAQEPTCWHAAHTANWTLKAELTPEGWVASVYDQGNERVAFTEAATSADDAKSRALYFVNGIAPPKTFHEGSTIKLNWTRCDEAIRDT